MKAIEPHVYKCLMEVVKPNACIGLVGGSDFPKMVEQMGSEKCKLEVNFLIF